jgi:hypothetical protein
MKALHPTTTLKMGFEFRSKGREFEITRLHWHGKEIFSYEFVDTDSGEQLSRTFEQMMLAQEQGHIEHDYPSDQLIDSFATIEDVKQELNTEE